MTGNSQRRGSSPPSRPRRATPLAVGLALAAAALVATSAVGRADAAAAPVLRCTAPEEAPLMVFHGGRLTLAVVGEPGRPGVAAVDLAAGQPDETPDYRLTRLTRTRWTFESLRVDPPSRTARHRVLLRVGLADGSEETVRCDVLVVHREVVAGARCRPDPLAIRHGQAGVLRIVRIPGSAPIVSTGLAGGYPAWTAKRGITKLGNTTFRIRSRVVDGPKRVETYVVRIRVRFGTPGNVVASIVKKCVVRVRHEQPQPRRQFQVGITTSADHDPPQSDICVTVTTTPAQPGVRARIVLHAPPRQPVGKDQAAGIALDARGSGRARFLVDQKGAHEIVAEVIGSDGVTVTSRTTLDNTQPYGRCDP